MYNDFKNFISGCNYLLKEKDKVVIVFEDYEGRWSECYLYNVVKDLIEKYQCDETIKRKPKTKENYSLSNTDGDYIWDTEYELISFQLN